ncbi:MAG: hypothetical protein U9R07_02585 [Pseudomonadota bacterium]|nr:hypothetical protein [Pseudomonadota bacterium]
MTGYLQRLFDRTAGLAGGAAQGQPGQPAMRPGSPLAQIDQRLGARELASDFTFGVGYDAGAEPDPDQPDGSDAAAAAPRNLRQPLPPLPAPQPAPQERRAPLAANDLLSGQPAGRKPEDAPVRPAETRSRAPLAAPEPAARPRPAEPESARAEPALRAAPAPAAALSPPVQARANDTLSAPPPGERTPSAPPPVSQPEGRAPPQPAPAPQPAEPALARAAEPRPVAEPAERDRPLPVAQPVRSGAEPPALPMPEPIDWREVDRRIAAAIDRQEQGKTMQPEPPAQAATPGTAEQARPTQTAPVYKTAAETSIIGPIEQTSRPRMLFGERLR